MHSKTLGRKAKLISVTLALAGLVGLSIQAPSMAVSATPNAACLDGTCWVTFDYTGDYSTWTPPSGITNLHFDVFGAQGGRTGGKGGQVSGDFVTVPTSLYIYVGGAGGSGNSTAGGFNGGGAAGSGHADQGSGGGASDIRASTAVSDRLIVAGGGGGMGGWVGGAGAPGGLTIASAGTKGSPSGTPGGGGTQTSGGVAGLGVSTGNGTAGSLAQGGNGGTGTVAGGGGGGGGFYGGGGGGSDNVAGGSDGAGGGGGSSFATMALTTNIIHTAGVRSGNGQVVLRYTFPPTLLNFFPLAGGTSTSSTVIYQLTFDQYTLDVDQWDFNITGTTSGCYISRIGGDGYNYQVTVSNCASGLLQLSLRPNSVFGSTYGPVYEAFATSVVRIDTQSPGFQLKAPASPSNTGTLHFTLTGDEPFQQPTASAFYVFGSGCQVSAISMTSTTTADITVSGCVSGADAFLKLKASQIKDILGNLGPLSDLPATDVIVDLDPPAVSSIQAANPVGDLIAYTINFSEPVTGFSADSLTFGGTGCALSKIDGSGQTYQVWLVGCSGSANLTVKNNSVRDASGNPGPISDQVNSGGSSDAAAPAATVVELNRTDKTVSPSFEIRFDKVVSGLTINSLSRSGTAKNCTFVLNEVTAGRVYRVDSTGCGPGTLKLTLLAQSVSDARGNLGPAVSVDSLPARIALAPAVGTNVSGASVHVFPASSSTHLNPTVPQIPRRPIRVKSAQLPAKTQGIKLPTLTTESWVSLVIAMIALAIANRPRGRRRAAITRK